MKNKVLVIALVLVLVACLSFGLVACNPDQGQPTKYAVTVAQGSGYTVSGINADGYTKDAEVKFTVEVTDAAKQLKQVSADGQVLTAESDGSYKFTMPEKAVEISVVLENRTPSVALSSLSLVLNARVDETANVTATVTPDLAIYELEWESDDDEVATVTPAADGKSAVITAIAKGQATISVSVADFDDVEAKEIAVNVINVRPWTNEEKEAMSEHLHGIVLYPMEQEDMEASWDAQNGEVVIEGDEVVGYELAEYAALYTAADGWVDITENYAASAGTLYVYEKAVETDGGTRYVRVHIYATEGTAEDDFAIEGSFYVEAYDPYEYEWPAEYFAENLKSVLSKETVPSVDADYYEISVYGVLAYYASDEEGGGYGAILTAAGYTVSEDAGYYRAVSNDGMYVLAFAYEDGTLLISVLYNNTGNWPAAAIANAFVYYEEEGTTAFELPEFEGEGVSFVFADGYFNKFWINEGRAHDMYGEVSVRQSTAAFTDAYKAKLVEAGWAALGTDGTYIKEVADSDDQVSKIKVSFEQSTETTTITVYYFSIEDPRVGWDDNLIKANHGFYKYTTDKIPAYTGDIDAFSADKEYVYVTVPENDFAGLMDAYKQILVQAGFVLEGASAWTEQYYSPNRQYGIKLSTPSGKPNTLCLYIQNEQPSTSWNANRINDSLQYLGSSIENIPEFESEITCDFKYEIRKTYSTPAENLRITIKPSDSNDSLSQADCDAYKAVLEEAGWTLGENGRYVGSDGKTQIQVLTYDSYYGVRIDVYYVEA